MIEIRLTILFSNSRLHLQLVGSQSMQFHWLLGWRLLFCFVLLFFFFFLLFILLFYQW